MPPLTLAGMTRLTTALVLFTFATAPAWADAADPHRCNLFCKVWRNVSGKVQTPVSAQTWDDAGLRAPTPDEEARPPRTADLVTVHGDLLRKSRAERQHEREVAAAQIKRINALREDDGKSAEASHASNGLQARRPE